MLLPFLSRNSTNKDLKIWAFSDAHQADNVGDLERAVLQMDQIGFDIAVGLGDFWSGNASDGQGVNIVNELNNFTNKDISDVYSLGGNHDYTEESFDGEGNFHFKKYIDPLGENPSTSLIVNANRPFPVIGQYDSYHLEIGNLLIIMLGDSNDGPAPMGRDTLGTSLPARRAAGGISLAQWNWFKNLVESNKDKNIIVCSHQGIKDTNIGTGFNEFFPAYNRDANYSYPSELHSDPEESKKGGYIAYIENQDGASEIDQWLMTNGKHIDLWLHAHYHFKIGETWNGRGYYTEKYGTRFFNVAQINHTYGIFYNNIESKSNLISIKGNRLTIETHVHKDYLNVIPEGIYEPMKKEIQLKSKLIL